jgi:hypothetical protein
VGFGYFSALGLARREAFCSSARSAVVSCRWPRCKRETTVPPAGVMVVSTGAAPQLVWLQPSDREAPSRAAKNGMWCLDKVSSAFLGVE